MIYRSSDFIIAPGEMEHLLEPFTLFVNNAHVPADYHHTPTDEFINSYGRLYEKLCRGDKPDHRADHELLGHYAVTTDISSVNFGDEHIYEGKRYKLCKGSDRGYAPYLAPFALTVYSENGRLSVSTRGSYMVGYTEIAGYQMVFPKLSAAEAAIHGIGSEQEWDSYNDYMLFRKAVMDITSALVFEKDGVVKKTSVRISDKAKEAVRAFHFVDRYGLTVI